MCASGYNSLISKPIHLITHSLDLGMMCCRVWSRWCGFNRPILLVQQKLNGNFLRQRPEPNYLANWLNGWTVACALTYIYIYKRAHTGNLRLIVYANYSSHNVPWHIAFNLSFDEIEWVNKNNYRKHVCILLFTCEFQWFVHWMFLFRFHCVENLWQLIFS